MTDDKTRGAERAAQQAKLRTMIADGLARGESAEAIFAALGDEGMVDGPGGAEWQRIGPKLRAALVAFSAAVLEINRSSSPLPMGEN